MTATNHDHDGHRVDNDGDRLRGTTARLGDAERLREDAVIASTNGDGLSGDRLSETCVGDVERRLETRQSDKRTATGCAETDSQQHDGVYSMK